MKPTLKRATKRTLRLARALGQSEEILRQIEEGNAHPIMAAYGLWPDDGEIDDLGGGIARGRNRASSRPEIRL
jgi:hypothetical protein